MLETLPIVKFGDPEPAKSANGDVELENGKYSSCPVTKTDFTADGTRNSPAAAAIIASSAQSGVGSDTQPKSGDNEAQQP
ncbi:hypothetical protein DID88_009586 [Monilinia fructigena]|uniref:Uncharacterized protein n=1 Tax=Monilinia fructigena TaxID=38457 RepID=A0A395IML9_9HELO|nr:hypothetical protein DID88_009586 [Monilinia fructigena]